MVYEDYGLNQGGESQMKSERSREREYNIKWQRQLTVCKSSVSPSHCYRCRLWNYSHISKLNAIRFAWTSGTLVILWVVLVAPEPETAEGTRYKVGHNRWSHNSISDRHPVQINCNRETSGLNPTPHHQPHNKSSTLFQFSLFKNYQGCLQHFKNSNSYEMGKHN